MFAVTAATFPSAMATSRTALILFLGSMTWPPFNRGSYLRCAVTWLTLSSTSDTPTARHVACKAIASSPAIVVPLGTPCRHQVFAHVERSGHAVGRDRAVEAEAQGIAVAFGIRAGHLNAVPVDRADEVARHEVALMRTFDAIVHLSQMERMAGRVRGELDAYIQSAGQTVV